MEDYKEDINVSKNRFLTEEDCKVDRNEFVKNNFPNECSDKVILDIIQFFLEFHPDDCFMESLLDLIVNSVPKYISHISEVLFYLCCESIENFEFLMNPDLALKLCKAVGDVFPEYIEPTYLTLILFEKAIKKEIIDEFPLCAYEFIFLINIKYQSDSLNSSITKNSYVLISSLCMSVFNQLIDKDIIENDEVINEILDYFFYFIDLQSKELQSLGILGVSKIAQRAPEIASEKLLSYNIILKFQTLISKESAPFVQSTAIDILTSIASLENDEAILTLIGLGILYQLDFENRDEYFKESVCALIGNLLLETPLIIEEIVKSGILQRMCYALKNENFSVKRAAALALAKVSSLEFAVDFFSSEAILYYMLEILPEVQEDEREELAQSFLIIYQKACFNNIDDIIVQLESNEFFEVLDELASEASDESFLIQLREEISAHKVVD